MRCFYLVILIVFGGLFIQTSAYASMNIFACEPEWGALAREIGGNQARVFVAISARQDPHNFRVTPNLVTAMRGADLVICSGASLEIGWLPTLLEKAGNPKIQPGNIGSIMAAELVHDLGKPISVDRSQGDMYPEGNPQIHLNPHNIEVVASQLVDRMEDIDTADAEYFQARYGMFARKWQMATTEWQQQALALKGMRVVVDRASFTYLIDWLGLVQVGTLEPQPGIPPTSSHLENLVQALKKNPADAILRTPYDSVDASTWLSEKTGIPAVMLPFTVGGDKETTNLFMLFTRTIQLLKQARHAWQ